MIRPAPTIAVVLLLVLGGACKSAASEATGNRGVSAIQFQDVVVPSGMRLRDASHESHSVEASGWRFGHFVYTGLVRIDEAAAYVRERMPQHAWSLIRDDAPDQFTRRLRFSRAPYVADYTIRRQEGQTQMVVEYQTEVPSR